jgi:hypothetical protein
MKYLLYLVVTLSTCATGIALSPIQFYWESIACGFGSSKSYRSSYFVKTSFAHEGYPTFDKATEVFNRRLNEAAKVIEVTPKVNKDGLTVGQRAVVLFHEPNTNDYYVSIIWTDGRGIHSISSSSFLHVVEFEKRHLDD